MSRVRLLAFATFVGVACTGCGSDGAVTVDGVTLVTADAPSGSDVARVFELVGVDGGCVVARIAERDGEAAVLVAPEGTRLEMVGAEPILHITDDRLLTVKQRLEVGGAYGSRTDDPKASDVRPVMNLVSQECDADRDLIVHDWGVDKPS